MRKCIMTWMLLVTGITGTLCAQNKPGQPAVPQSSDPFFIPPGVIRDSFYLKLDKGNSLLVGLSNLADIETLMKMDSVLTGFQGTMQDFEDSLSDPLLIKTVYFLTDESGRKFIRIRRFKPMGENYLLSGNGKSRLKIEQDTVRIIRKIQQGAERYVLLTFLVNDYHQVFDYEKSGLDSALGKIYAAARSQTHWTEKNNDHLKLNSTYSLAEAVQGTKARVVPRFHERDYLSPLLEGNLQNVYQYLSPSVNLGIMLGFPKGDLNRDLKLGWEPMFLFAKNSAGVLKAYRNDWLTAEFDLYSGNTARKYPFTGNFSLGYLVSRKGDFFEKNTFRLGLGGLRQGKLTLQPVIYFHDVFKGVSPGLRFSVSF